MGAHQSEGTVICNHSLTDLVNDIHTFFSHLEKGKGNVATVGTSLTKKLSAIPLEWISILQTCCDVLVIEADGAKCCPLKGSAFFEPVISPCTTFLITSVGATAFTSSLSANEVHRPQIVSTILSKPIGSPLSVDDIASVCLSPLGHFKALHLCAKDPSAVSVGRMNHTPDTSFVSSPSSFICCAPATPFRTKNDIKTVFLINQADANRDLSQTLFTILRTVLFESASHPLSDSLQALNGIEMTIAAISLQQSVVYCHTQGTISVNPTTG
ncbi:hypothetical protein BLNAU_13210 [Blattamonas nauphoetae]|uniref:Uncharacterized protein n=1 Tax=Blattamonas nauphoetae TaxID=2049346 RepID=A0ABQ9XKW0_9EUKA|nr:hypothetical protein BLNAU_13210 [Blattamonas nauphoetae]